MNSLTELLVCPACHGMLVHERLTLVCANCAAVYSVTDGIPVLVSDLDDVKIRQAAWFDEEVDEEYEIERPHGTPRLHAWLLEEKFRRSVTRLRPMLNGTIAAAVCAGSGMDAEFLARSGARVIALDVSLGAARRAAERARRRGIEIVPVVADAERLPLRDGSVDLGYVHDGLHHLERPLLALGELARIARRGVSVTEPARAAATKLSVAVGYSGDTEEAGNEVARLLPAEVSEVLTAGGFDIVAEDRYAMVYRHEAGWPVRLLSRSGTFGLGKAGFRILNIPIGPIGNKLTVQAVRRPDRRPRRIAVHDFGGFPFPVQLSRELAKRGNTVLHLHCPSYPNGRGRLQGSSDDSPSFTSEPIELGHQFRKYSPIGRPLDELKYRRRLRHKLRHFRPEIILSDSPLLVQSATLSEARRIGANFVFWQQDIHGFAMRDIVRSRLPVLGRLLSAIFPRLERRLLLRSDAVVPIGESFLEALENWGVPSSQTTVIENWAPIEELPVCQRSNLWRSEHGLGTEVLFLYAGTLGLKHDCDLLFELAPRLAAEGARLVVVSEGLGADQLRARLNREATDGLLLLPFQPFERLAEMHAAADVLVALLDRGLSPYSIPSKVLTYHCAARPLLAAMPSDNPASQLILSAGSGIVVEPEERDRFLGAAIQLLKDEGLRRELGQRARTYADETFAIGKVADRFETVFDQLNHSAQSQ